MRLRRTTVLQGEPKLMPRSEQLSTTAMNPSSRHTKARIYTAIPAPGISLYCQPAPVKFCSPVLDKFFYIPLLCTGMFIQQLIKPSMIFLSISSGSNLIVGKRNVGMNLLSLSAGSRGSCRSKNISPFVCRPCPRIKGLPKSRPTCKTQVT